MAARVLVVGSLNPVKVESVRLASSEVFPEGVECSGVSASSEIPDQVSEYGRVCDNNVCECV